MAGKNGDPTKDPAERARRMVKRMTGNKEFMAGVERGIEAGRRGEGVPLKDLQRKNAPDVDAILQPDARQFYDSIERPAHKRVSMLSSMTSAKPRNR